MHGESREIKQNKRSHAGLQNNINHAATANVFKDKGSRPTISAIVKIENILTERTTDGESPVKKAKVHNKTRRKTERTHLPIFPLRAIGFRMKKSIVYKSPICKPDKARIWLAPTTE